MQKTDRTYATSAGELPRRPHPSMDEMYAYEPDRESPERERVMSCSSAPSFGGYLVETRARKQREEAPRRRMSSESFS